MFFGMFTTFFAFSSKKGVWSRLLYLATGGGKGLEVCQILTNTERDMFDTMTLTKITAAVCSALLVYVLGGWIAGLIYSPGHHGDDHGQAYVIDTGASEDAGAAVEEGPVFAELLAVADVAKGERVFKKCAACHKLDDGVNGVGPHLYGLLDRAVGSVDGYGYSGALVKVADTWSAENLNGFFEKPRSYAPGTAMGFAGLKKPEDRANLIAYLATIGG